MCVSQEFRHFVSILVPPREVPSYLELILAMMIDVKAAFQVHRYRVYSLLLASRIGALFMYERGPKPR